MVLHSHMMLNLLPYITYHISFIYSCAYTSNYIPRETSISSYPYGLPIPIHSVWSQHYLMKTVDMWAGTSPHTTKRVVLPLQGDLKASSSVRWYMVYLQRPESIYCQENNHHLQKTISEIYPILIPIQHYMKFFNFSFHINGLKEMGWYIQKTDCMKTFTVI